MQKVLVHSYSSVVLSVLESLSKLGINIEIITTEARPTPEGVETNGHKVKEFCRELGLECKLIPDSSVAMEMN